MSLPDRGLGERLTASEEKVSHSGALRRVWSAFGERVVDIRKSECEVSETEQALATDHLGI